MKENFVYPSWPSFIPMVTSRMMYARNRRRTPIISIMYACLGLKWYFVLWYIVTNPMMPNE